MACSSDAKELVERELGAWPDNAIAFCIKTKGANVIFWNNNYRSMFTDVDAGDNTSFTEEMPDTPGWRINEYTDWRGWNTCSRSSIDVLIDMANAAGKPVEPLTGSCYSIGHTAAPKNYLVSGGLMNINKKVQNLKAVSVNQWGKELESYISTQVPCIGWGGYGVGKSALVQQVCDKLGMRLVDLRLTQMHYDELVGVLHIKDGTSCYTWPWYLPRDGRPTVIMLDELAEAHGDAQLAAYQLLQERRIGQHKVPDNVSFVCASNPSNAAYLKDALANRLAHALVYPDYHEWLKWGTKNSIYEPVLVYISAYPMHLYKENGEFAFPSPRSWHNLSKLLVHNYKQGKRQHTCIGLLGPEVGANFYHVLRDDRIGEVARHLMHLLINGIKPDDSEFAAAVATIRKLG